MTVFIFACIAATIVYAGSKLALYADILAERWGLSQGAMGVLLLSMVTTLPEMTTSLSAITRVDSPDLAIGNVLGSLMFNLTLIAVCDLLFRRGGILRRADREVVLPACGALVMVLLIVAALFFTLPLRVGPLHFGAGTVMVIFLYFAIFMAVQRFGRVDLAPVSISGFPLISTRKAFYGFVVSALVVVACGFGLALSGDRLAGEFGLSHSFVGALFLALATSLPEYSVGIAAVRRGSYNLMLGNIMGANMLNAFIVAISDIFYSREALGVPRNVSSVHLVMAGFAAVATVVIIWRVLKRRRIAAGRFIGWDSALLLVMHAVCLLIVFREWF